MKKSLFKFFIIAMAGLLCSCAGKSVSKHSVAVFVPGIMADSPIYDMLAKGVQDAVDEYNEGKSQEEKSDIFIMEAGTNQAEWGTKILSLAATQKYDIIISSNPSLPDLVAPILEQFPDQKFILLDAECEGNNNIYSIRYNQAEQAFLSGCIARVMSNTQKIALVAAQEYPVMNNIIFPNYCAGYKYAQSYSPKAPEFEPEFRIVGNWYDANKSAVISDALINDGVDVILPICGGAAQGVINSAVNSGTYIAWFDSNGFDRAPGTVISSTSMKQRDLSKIVTLDYFEGKTNWGKADLVGMKEGFIEFIEDDPLYVQSVPEDKRNYMNEVVNAIKNGTISF
ncbi:MAG: BMP family ABC transporter substrate-binding protein [Treponema sp.]|nr:BMP family ABC transporter substrate-binding protein [Treponema sp.]